jgi:hypothetical protein
VEEKPETEGVPESSIRSLILRWVVFPAILFALFVLYFNSPISTFRPPKEVPVQLMKNPPQANKNPWALDKLAPPAR